MLKTMEQPAIHAAGMGEQGPRELASVAYGVACSWVGGQLCVLFVELARATERRLGEFNPQDLASTAWALTDSAACALES